MALIEEGKGQRYYCGTAVAVLGDDGDGDLLMMMTAMVATTMMMVMMTRMPLIKPLVVVMLSLHGGV